MIRRSGDRTVTSAGVLVAAGLLGLAGVSAVRAAFGGTVWLPLHLALAGAAGTAIAAVLPFFTTALGKAAPAPMALRVAAVGLIAGGALVAGLGMSTAQPGLAAIGGGGYLVGLAATAAAAFLPLRSTPGFRLRLVELAYLVAIARGRTRRDNGHGHAGGLGAGRRGVGARSSPPMPGSTSSGSCPWSWRRR